MSRKDWQLIAEVLRKQDASMKLIRALADMFKANYSNFDYWRFVQASFAGDFELAPKGV